MNDRQIQKSLGLAIELQSLLLKYKDSFSVLLIEG